MADFIDFEVEVDTTDSELNENDGDDVKPLIDDSFEPDNDLLFYYKCL